MAASGPMVIPHIISLEDDDEDDVVVLHTQRRKGYSADIPFDLDNDPIVVAKTRFRPIVIDVEDEGKEESSRKRRRIASAGRTYVALSSSARSGVSSSSSSSAGDRPANTAEAATQTTSQLAAYASQLVEAAEQATAQPPAQAQATVPAPATATEQGAAQARAQAAFPATIPATPPATPPSTSSSSSSRSSVSDITPHAARPRSAARIVVFRLPSCRLRGLEISPVQPCTVRSTALSETPGSSTQSSQLGGLPLDAHNPISVSEFSCTVEAGASTSMSPSSSSDNSSQVSSSPEPLARVVVIRLPPYRLRELEAPPVHPCMTRSIALSETSDLTARSPPLEGLPSDANDPPPSNVKSWPAEAIPGSSIPFKMSKRYAKECLDAARNSRLHPFALHPGELQLLGTSAMSKHAVTVYLNIRNRILHLWHDNPKSQVTDVAAFGCATQRRFFGLADAAFLWLFRCGYINHGCSNGIDVIKELPPGRRSESRRRRKLVILGAGISGLACARQLEALIAFHHHRGDWHAIGELPPTVQLIEARTEVGGRIRSQKLATQIHRHPCYKLLSRVETGAQIVLGFEGGNPMNEVIRKQLELKLYTYASVRSYYDYAGKELTTKRALRAHDLHDDINARTVKFRIKPTGLETILGDESKICHGVDPSCTDIVSISTLTLSQMPKETLVPGAFQHPNVSGHDKTAHREAVQTNHVTLGLGAAAETAKMFGFALRRGIKPDCTFSIDRVAKDVQRYPALGNVIAHAIREYKTLIDLTPLDMRVLNWNLADMEYGSAASMNDLSLSGHDQDSNFAPIGGDTTSVIGGYQQIPQALASTPTALDIQLATPIDSVTSFDHDDRSAGINSVRIGSGNRYIEADRVVCTLPLGILKRKTVSMTLPDRKLSAIDRMGWGLLNKLILVFPRVFWPNTDSDSIFGMLNIPDSEDMYSTDPEDYRQGRGRFYLIWNCSTISGQPVLSALMAGDSARDAEREPKARLVEALMARLRGAFGRDVPNPVESVLTRWGDDQYTRGTYSNVAVQTEPEDYNILAEPVGKLHFAGEHTNKDFPATVHGAYLSGLRAAAEVIDGILGPIRVANPIVTPLEDSVSNSTATMATTATSAAIAVATMSNSSTMTTMATARVANTEGKVLDRPRTSRQHCGAKAHRSRKRIR